MICNNLLGRLLSSQVFDEVFWLFSIFRNSECKATYRERLAQEAGVRIFASFRPIFGTPIEEFVDSSKRFNLTPKSGMSASLTVRGPSTVGPPAGLSRNLL